MGLFDSFNPFAPTAKDDGNSGGFLYDVFDPLDFSGTRGKNAAFGELSKEDQERQRYKSQQYQLLGQMQAPTLTPQQEARIKALETESSTPLEQDPAFQSQMRQATGGGAQALSAIQNKQAATGAVGGFANQGSVSDVYDRLGTQLATLAQQQTAYKDRKRDTAADARQTYADSIRNFQNAQTQAKMAIESGDHQAVNDSMNRLYAAKAQADAALRQNAMSAAEVVAGAYTGNPSGVSNGTKGLAANSGANTGAGPTNEAYDNYNNSASPYASSNYFSSGLDGGNEYKPYYQTRYR